MKHFTCMLAIMAVAAFTSVTVAQDEAPTGRCPAQQAQTSAVANQEGEIVTCQECPVSAAMASLPKMTYKVGEESTCCSESAAKLAEESAAPIHYVVGDNVYESKEEAFVSLVESTEEMVNAYITPACCEESGTTTIAGETCDCPNAAAARTELVSKAVEDIMISYKVGEESVCCPNAAAALAEESGEAIHYVVGEEDTCCEMTARLTAATLRYKAAVQATLAEATPAPKATEAAPVESTETGSGT